MALSFDADDRVVETIAAWLRKQDLSIQLGVDFHEFRDRCNAQELRPPIKPPFDPNEASAQPLNGFWVCLYDQDGQLYQTQAMKLLTLEDTDLGTYTFQNRTTFPLECSPFNTTNITTSMTTAGHEITGRVAYHGELWGAPGPNGPRGTAITPLFARAVIRMALAYLRPDQYVCFMEPKNIMRGLAARLGYGTAEQGNLLFPKADGSGDVHVWMVRMSADEARYNTAVDLSLLISQFGERRRTVSPERHVA